jgi:hypothetical protein
MHANSKDSFPSLVRTISGSSRSVLERRSSGKCSFSIMAYRPSRGASPSLKMTGRMRTMARPASSAPFNTRLCVYTSSNMNQDHSQGIFTEHEYRPSPGYLYVTVIITNEKQSRMTAHYHVFCIYGKEEQHCAFLSSDFGVDSPFLPLRGYGKRQNKQPAHVQMLGCYPAVVRNGSSRFKAAS